MWKDKPGGTKEEHWIDLSWIDHNDENCWWVECSVKWDGCIHFSKAGNIPFEIGLDSNSADRESKGACDDYIHICDIDDLINKLIELRKVAKSHFKNEEWKDKRAITVVQNAKNKAPDVNAVIVIGKDNERRTFEK